MKKSKKEKKEKKEKSRHKKRDRESSSSSSSHSNDSDNSDNDDDDAPRSIITGKRIKLDLELTYEDRVKDIERQAKRHAMNTQY